MKKYITLYLIIVFIFTLIIGVGYTYKTNSIKIVGTTLEKNSAWDIHFENFKSHEITDYSIYKTELNYNANLKKPGDYYEFTVDVVNDGNIDAVVNNVTVTGLTQEQEKYIKYTITNNNDKELVHNQVLRHNTKRKIKVKVEYKKDITKADLKTSNQNILLTFKIDYTEKENRKLF